MVKEKNRRKVLFLCTGNSCRSQMAEGWTRKLLGDWIEAWSAGVAPTRVDPRAVAVMLEAGVDISSQYAKNVDAIRHIPFDLVITLCGHARETCPAFPGPTSQIHHPFDDPPRLAATAHSETEAYTHYRRVRDEIRAFVLSLPAIMSAESRSGTDLENRRG